MDAGELALHGRAPGPLTVLGDGTSLPFVTASVDVAYSSNVAEHVSSPWLMADEMVRVTRPGGIGALSYTLWFGPWGGHETSPWHYSAAPAPPTATSAGRQRPKNDFGRSMFRDHRGGRSALGSRPAPLAVGSPYCPAGGPRWYLSRLVRGVVAWTSPGAAVRSSAGNLACVGRRGR